MFCMHFGARISHLRAHLAFGFECPLGFLAFWLLAFWLLAFGFARAFSASLRILHLVCWSFGLLPLACARGMKPILISVLTSPFRGKKRMSGHLLNLDSNYIHVIWVEQLLQETQTFNLSAHLAFGFECPLGFWLLASGFAPFFLAFGFWFFFWLLAFRFVLLAFGFTLALGFWLLAFGFCLFGA